MARKPAAHTAPGTQDATEHASPLNETEALALAIGANLRRLRTRQGLSLERLAALSGVSRAMLSQIELGKSVPTISLLWKVSKALDVPFSALNTDYISQGNRVLRADKAKILTSMDGSFSSRALFPHDESRKVEFYELELKQGASEEADAHAPGTVENLVVTRGEVEIDVGSETYRLREKDAIHFQADAYHVYRNVGEGTAVMYLVMVYAEPVG